MKRNWLKLLAGTVVVVSGCSESVDNGESEYDPAGHPNGLNVDRTTIHQPLDVAEHHALSGPTRSDRDYIRALERKSTEQGFRINFTDPIQNRYVNHHLLSVGKTPENSPQLFDALEKQRQLAFEQKSTGEQQAMEEGDITETDTVHRITNVFITGTTVIADVILSTHGGTAFSYLDASIYDEIGNYLMDEETISVEETDEGSFVWLHASGKLQGNNCLYVNSYALTDGGRDDGSSDIGIEACLHVGGKLEEPRDQELPGVPKDGRITVCLNRSWLYDAYDCEYRMEGTGNRVIFPLKGYFDFGYPITAVRRANVYMTMPNNGGGCRPNIDLIDIVEIDGSTTGRLSWNISRADFGSRCFSHQQQVSLNIGAEVVLDIDGTAINASGLISSEAQEEEIQIEKIRFAYSCFAEGTMIRTADGALQPIETIEQDAQILADHDGLTLSAVDMSTGIEDIPMIRLDDQLGHSLLVTEGHPIIVPGIGPLRADQLRPGDELMTEQGISALVKVSSEMYDGLTYNLKLGNTSELKYIGPNDTTMFANGILVGDGRIQSAIENANDRPIPSRPTNLRRK